MSGWWYVLAIVALAAGGLLYLRARRHLGGVDRTGRRTDDRPAGARSQGDFTTEREDNRVAHMSEADRTWEAASLQRDQEARARANDPAEPRA